MPIIQDLHSQVKKPGIYFEMPNEVYHNDKSLSNSGMNKIHKTPRHFWQSSPFNPDREPVDTIALKQGKVLHTLLMEPHKFSKEWQIKPGVQNTKEAGKIGEGAYKDLCKAVASIRSDRNLSALFDHGFPELSIFWIDETTGVPLRIRPDFTSIFIIGDLKGTADLSTYKLGYSIADYGYYRQAPLYLEGLLAVKKLIKEGVGVVEGCPDEEWLDQFLARVHDKFVFAFQEKEEPFVTRALTLCERTNEVGTASCQKAMAIFKQNYEAYGEGKWPSGYEGQVELIQLDDLPPKINY